MIKPARKISWFVVLSIIFMHFMIASPLDYPLTITPFALAYFIYKHYELSVRVSILPIAAFLIFWPLILLIRYDFLGAEADLYEFLRTYLLWLFALIALLVGTINRVRTHIDYSREHIMLTWVIVLYSAAEVLAAKLLNSTALYYPFGSYSYKGETDEGRFVWDGFERANAFYLEPSFCSFILFFLLVSILIKKNMPRRILSFLFAGFGSMLIVGSASGLFAVAGLAVFVLSSFLRNGIVKMLVMILLTITGVLGGLWLLPDRISEINVEGTSGYWRLVAPLTILVKVLSDFPLGIPFGQVEAYVEPFGLQHAQSIGTSIDNGMYILMFYFGWLAVIFFAVLIFKFVVAWVNNEHRAIAFWWFIIISLQFSGGVMTPEYFFPLLLVIYTYREALNDEKTRWIAADIGITFQPKVKAGKPTPHTST